MATVAEALRIGLADQGRRMSLQEFLDAEEEEGYRYELARGVLEVSYVPGSLHGLIVCALYRMLAAYWERHPRHIFRFGGAAEFRVFIPAMVSGRNPDVAVSLRDTPRNDRGDPPPSLAIEVVSEGDEARTRDYVTKREEYLVFGLGEYWIVDRFLRRVTVLERRGQSWVEHVFGDGDSAESHVLPGFAVPVAELWAAADGASENDETDENP